MRHMISTAVRSALYSPRYHSNGHSCSHITHSLLRGDAHLGAHAAPNTRMYTPRDSCHASSHQQFGDAERPHQQMFTSAWWRRSFSRLLQPFANPCLIPVSDQSIAQLCVLIGRLCDSDCLERARCGHLTEMVCGREEQLHTSEDE